MSDILILEQVKCFRNGLLEAKLRQVEWKDFSADAQIWSCQECVGSITLSCILYYLPGKLKSVLVGFPTINTSAQEQAEKVDCLVQ